MACGNPVAAMIWTLTVAICGNTSSSQKSNNHVVAAFEWEISGLCTLTPLFIELCAMWTPLIGICQALTHLEMWKWTALKLIINDLKTVPIELPTSTIPEEGVPDSGPIWQHSNPLPNVGFKRIALENSSSTVNVTPWKAIAAVFYVKYLCIRKSNSMILWEPHMNHRYQICCPIDLSLTFEKTTVFNM